MAAPPGPRLRVLVLASTFPARSGDGTPEFVLTLSRALAREGMDVRVVVPRVPGAAKVETLDGLSVRRFAYFPKQWEDLADGAIMANLHKRRSRWVQVVPLLIAFQIAALRELRRQRPHVVHAHWIVPAGIVARLLKLITGIPYVVTAHGADAYTLRSGLALRVKRTVLRHAEATMPVSGAIGSELAVLGPVTEAVPMGVDVGRIRAEVGARRPESGRVLFVGRLVDKKGVNVLLDATSLVPHARVVIAGDGPQLPELKRQAHDLHIADRVEFLGQCPRAEVMSQLARAAVVALPSQVGTGGDQDGVPVVLGEAMAAGVPVVASNLGGLGEYIEDGVTGLLVEPGSCTELAEAVGRLIDKTDYAAELARAAAQRTVGTLDVDYVVRRCRAVLLAAAGS